jgi:hypothetical protein
MRGIGLNIIAVATSLLTGCATHEQSPVPLDYVLFNADPKSGLWRPRHVDFQARAKEYAKAKRLNFRFEGTEAILLIFQREGVLVARVQFSGYFGTPFLTVEMDASGKVLQHYTGVASEGPPHSRPEQSP